MSEKDKHETEECEIPSLLHISHAVNSKLNIAGKFQDTW